MANNNSASLSRITVPATRVRVKVSSAENGGISIDTFVVTLHFHS